MTAINLLASIGHDPFAAISVVGGTLAGAGAAIWAMKRHGKSHSTASPCPTGGNRSMLDASSDAVFGLNPEGRIHYANPAAARLSGFDTSELIGRPIEQFLAIQNDAVPAGRAQPGTILARDGARTQVELSRSSVDSAGSAIGGEILICRNVDHRLLDDQITAHERDVLEAIAASRSLDDVVDNVSAMAQCLSRGLRLAVLVRREGLSHCFGNIPPEMRRMIERLDSSSGISISWWNAPRVIDDVTADRDLSPMLDSCRLAGVRSWWSFPVNAPLDGETLAVLIMFPTDAITPDEHQRAIAGRCGRLIYLAAERERLTQRLATQSLLDPLTALPNRMLTSDRLGHALKRARRSGTQLAAILIDLDGFKAINDSLGNQNGDQLLKMAADRLRPAVRSSDTLGRLGNDQFTLIAADITDSAIAIICDRLQSAFRQPFEIAGKHLTLTASIGISCYPSDGEDVNALLRNADTALLHCKRQNKGGYRMFEPSMTEATLERTEIENQLRGALQNNEIVVFYQPQCDADGRVVAVEALARWRRNGTLIPPMKFIPIAEESGLIVPIGTWILQEACRWCKGWQKSGRTPLRVSVNVSALQFAQDDFVQMVRNTLTESDLDPCWLEVEVTESLLMQNTTNVAAKLQKLRDMGVAVAIDDFGTGYSSLAYLQKLPIDILKIDRSFVKDIPNATDLDSDKTAVIRAILSMAHSLQLHVVAEGVETEIHLQFLRRVGCHLMQGYYFSPPKSGEEIVAVVERLDRAALPCAA